MEFCKNLGRSGSIIDLIVLDSYMLPETEYSFRQICRSVYLGAESRSITKILWLIFMRFRLQFNKYDAIYTNGQGDSINLFAGIFFNYRMWVHHHHTAGDDSDQLTWSKNYVKALKKADKVIACSYTNAQYLSAVLKRKIETISCFSRKVEIKQNDVLGEKVRLGYYGRLIPEKGIDIMCRLSDDPELRFIQFHIWGEGSRYPASHFQQFPSLEYHGKFDGQQELSAVIETLDGLLLLSTHPEGLPISLLEVMSAGLPWLATDKGGIPDIAFDKNSTRVISASSDYVSIRKAVVSFASDIQAGKISRNIQRDTYNRKFSSDVLISQWKDTFGIF